MLLHQLIQQQQEQYLAIQQQIEKLQEQQRQIQAFMQQLGGVESQMESAVQLVQEAIASINEVCPDELDNFQEIVTGLFGKPIAALSGTDDEPTPPDDDPDGGVAIEVEADDEPTPPDDDPDGGVAIEVETEVVDTPNVVAIRGKIESAIASMSYRKAKDVCRDYGLSTSGKQAKLKERLFEHVDALDDLQVMGFWEYLNDGDKEAA